MEARQEDLRALVNRMADEQLSMQERMPSIPQRYLKEHLDRMDELAARLSRLATELIERSSR